MIHRKLRFSAGHYLLAFVFMITGLTTTMAQDDVAAAPAAVESASGGNAEAGKALFKANCASCHKLYKKAVGPALYGVSAKYDLEWLQKWIRNSAELIASGDADAVAIYNEYNQVAMNAFPGLTDQDIDDLLAYTDTPKPEPVVTTNPGGGGGTDASGGGVAGPYVLGGLAVVLLLLVAALFVVISTLKKFAQANGIDVEQTNEARKPLWKSFAENQFLVLVSSVALLFVGLYFAYGAMMNVGIDQGYAPVQPIHYSHRIHAGENQIECKFCHSSARESKHSGIPSLNVCMNCHKNIAEVAPETQQEGLNEYGVDYNKEIKKLYEATGWDPDKQAYTGEGKPVRWVRIHNLPDLAYFNHAQHVTAGGIACQTCHGPVEEMEIMSQHSPLTMGWCINCHRETNVDLKGNGYYEKIHKELSEKRGGRPLTIADLGGLECGKCHY